jgi:hypothetical protein
MGMDPTGCVISLARSRRYLYRSVALADRRDKKHAIPPRQAIRLISWTNVVESERGAGILNYGIS